VIAEPRGTDWLAENFFLKYNLLESDLQKLLYQIES